MRESKDVKERKKDGRRAVTTVNEENRKKLKRCKKSKVMMVRDRDRWERTRLREGGGVR